MRKFEDEYVSELEFDDGGMRGPAGRDGDEPALSVEKVAPFLYKMKTRRVDYDAAEVFARKYFQGERAFVKWKWGGDVLECATVVKNRLFGHNYDGPYDNTADFVVQTPAQHGRHAVICTAAIPGMLTADLVDAEEETEFVKEAYDVLPFFVIDGMNDMGLTVAINQMPYSGPYDDRPDDDEAMFCMYAARYILDYANSAPHAADLLERANFWYVKDGAIKPDFYLTISDGNQTFFVDLFGNHYWFGENDHKILTNFRIKERGVRGVAGNGDGSGTDNEYMYDDLVLPPGTENIELYSRGIERYEIIDEAYDELKTESDICSILSQVWYTGIYMLPFKGNTHKIWYSDYNGDWTNMGFGDLNIHCQPEDYDEIMAYFGEVYAQRNRSGNTMQTVHTAVYDNEMLTLAIVPQEGNPYDGDGPNGVIYRFCMDPAALVAMEKDRAIEAEEDILEELHENYETHEGIENMIGEATDTIFAAIDEGYYSIEEVDQALEDLYQAMMGELETALSYKLDKPNVDGTYGQVLVMGEDGTVWRNLPAYLPDVTSRDDGKIMAVEDGEWVLTDEFADYIRYINVTVSIVANDGGIPRSGLTVTIYDADSGDPFGELPYQGQPVSFRVARGMRYIVRQTGRWEGYHNPTPEYYEAAATNDTSVVFSYEAIEVPETLRELQIIVDGGNAATLANHIGLQFDDVYTESGVEYPVVWDLKEVKQVLDEENRVHTGVILEWHNSTPTPMPYDAPEQEEVDLSREPRAQAGLYYYGQTGNTFRLLTVEAGDMLPTTYDAVYKNSIRSADASIIRRGLAKYDESVPRKWLNSDAQAGMWWTATHVGDTIPEEAYLIPGFKAGCSAQILSMVKPVRIGTAAIGTGSISYTYDEFFLPSCAEVNGMNSVAGEGNAWQDWIDATGTDSPSNDANNGRKIYPVGSSAAQSAGLRSVNTGYQYIAWNISTDGSLDGYESASTPRRYTPCCVIY